MISKKNSVCSLKILIANSAFSDLQGIKEYYKDQGVPHIGISFISKIIKHIETLAKNPDIGRKVPEFDQEKLRELIHAPFRIVYLRELASIHVIRVWRSERLLVLDGFPPTR
ncbi:MAG: type II toxin-antitoxin system RelE/ParE family toxin [Proteobacteria bacterium]|nr:type II toxin-antitoxin system RelE/ParE family toxin [Pseudomonadota bacterium]